MRERRTRRTNGPATATRMNEGRKIASVATKGAGGPVQYIADEGCGGEDRAGRDLAHGHGIEELGLGQPVKVVHQVGTQKREQDVTTAKEHGTHLEEDQKEPQQTRGCDRCGSRRRCAAKCRERRHSHTMQSLAVGQSLGHQRQRASGGQDNQGVDADETGDRSAEPDRAEDPRLDRGAPKPEQGLQDDGNDHRFDAVEERGDLRQGAEANVGPGAASNDQRGREDETGAPEEQANPACAPVANEDRQLGRARTGDEVHRPEQVEEFLPGEPRAPADHLVLHHRDVGGGTAERGQTQAQEEDRHLTRRVRALARRGRPVSHAGSARV